MDYLKSQSSSSTSSKDDTLNLPRILCLHGGGTNARIFRAQCRSLSRALEEPRHFRLAYAEAPYPSGAGPDVLTVYASEGPFKRWLPWLPEHATAGHPNASASAVKGDDAAAVRDIDNALKRAMDADDRAGATGPWVGIIGFSQGAKLAASLLYRQQQRLQRREQKQTTENPHEVVDANNDDDDGGNIYNGWKFIVAMAGRAPIVDLEPHILFTQKSLFLARPTQIELGPLPDKKKTLDADDSHVLRLPSIHVHGLRDPGLHLHQALLDRYTDRGSSLTRLIQWDGGHRVVLKSTDVEPVVNAILQVARRVGVEV
ncbi:serine hydrolase FSH [Xylariaceae sp. FL0594]|nr:serine hydrolase FSH [Xylariaceae sp. FL0594]